LPAAIAAITAFATSAELRAYLRVSGAVQLLSHWLSATYQQVLLPTSAGGKQQHQTHVCACVWRHDQQSAQAQGWSMWLELLRSGIHGERTSKLQLVRSPLLAVTAAAFATQDDDAIRLAALQFLVECVAAAA
jgi:hypothetical protein